MSIVSILLCDVPFLSHTEDKTKREIHFQHVRLVSKDAVQLFAESSGTP